MTKRKTNPQHKAHFSFGCVCRCSCGWNSSVWYGKGSQRNAAGEWHGHLEKCEQAQCEEDIKWLFDRVMNVHPPSIGDA